MKIRFCNLWTVINDKDWFEFNLFAFVKDKNSYNLVICNFGITYEK